MPRNNKFENRGKDRKRKRKPIKEEKEEYIQLLWGDIINEII